MLAALSCGSHLQGRLPWADRVVRICNQGRGRVGLALCSGRRKTVASASRPRPGRGSGRGAPGARSGPQTAPEPWSGARRAPLVRPLVHQVGPQLARCGALAAEAVAVLRRDARARRRARVGAALQVRREGGRVADADLHHDARAGVQVGQARVARGQQRRHLALRQAQELAQQARVRRVAQLRGGAGGSGGSVRVGFRVDLWL